MHDIGNTVNRYDHAHSSAVLAYGILKEREMKLEDILTITSAIGQHDEENRYGGRCGFCGTDPGR